MLSWVKIRSKLSFRLLITKFSVTQQRFETDILRENVIVGNDALFKCSIPSFVSDFVSVQSWQDSEGNTVAVGNLGNWSDVVT